MNSVRLVDQTLRHALAPFHLRLVIVFGSMARGTARRDSDVDVAVLAGEPLSPQRKMEMMETITVALGRPVDLIDLHTVGEPLLGAILADGRRVLGAPAEWGRLLNHHLVEQADFVPLQNRILKARRDAWIKP